MDLPIKSRNFIEAAVRGIRQYFNSIDLVLFATAVALSLFSVLNIYGIVGAGNPLIQKQLLLIALGTGIMIALSFFNYRYLKNYSLPVLILYFGSIGLLLLTLTFQSIRGINAWIIFGGFTFEPSELAKLTLIIVLAKYFSQRHIHINQLRHIIVSGIYFAIPTLIILAQPDLGSAAIVGLIWFGILMAAGINKRHFFVLVTMTIVGAYLAWIFALQPYQKERISAFLNPYQDPTGFGYNIIQSKIAAGSGGLWGNGLGGGSQATLGFLPEAHNDFAFSAMAEQFGFLGVVVLFGGMILLIWRIISIGEQADNNFGKLFAIGMTILIFAHAVISAAVNVGLMPITGIPFPFLSYGGSHLISVMAGLGILQSIKRYG